MVLVTLCTAVAGQVVALLCSTTTTSTPWLATAASSTPKEALVLSLERQVHVLGECSQCSLFTI